MQFFERWLSGPFWNQEILQNSVVDYVGAVVIFVVALLLLKIFQIIILKQLEQWAKRTKTDLDDRFIAIFKSLKPPFYGFLAFYIALVQLTIHPTVHDVLNAILIGWVVYQAIKIVEILIDFFVRRKYSDEDDASTRSSIKLLSSLTKGILWVLGGLMILQNIGVNVTSLIAGLGIGGVAVALAVQNILSDLFSSFAIHFDKPFVVGDFIVVGDKMGTVEKIGIKTTRIRALQGEEIVFANKKLTSTEIQNFKKMQERRVVFHIGVVYETTIDQLKQAKKIISQAIEDVENARLDRVHFFAFGDSALKFEVVYYILSADYNEYMDIHESVHLRIKEELDRTNIEMAFPTQTIHLSQS